jgi:hypothetical protein
MSANTPANPLTLTFGRLTPTFDPEAFSNAVADHGFILVHHRATICPVGMIDQFDHRKVHPPHDNCSNGYIFEQIGEIACLFTGNSNSTQIIDPGLLMGSSVQLTFSPYYENSTTPVTLMPQDRLYLKESLGYVTGNKLFTASENGLDYTQFPIDKVQVLYDAKGLKYTDSDFTIQNGLIKWGNRRPDPGTICSIRYLYTPYWYVARLMHEIRLAKVNNPMLGERSTARMPYSAICKRENVGRDEQNRISEGEPLNPRQVPGPSAQESEWLTT